MSPLGLKGLKKAADANLGTALNKVLLGMIRPMLAAIFVFLLFTNG